jgi:L-xylulokinase
MFADVMKLPVEVVDVNETGALGCAIIGATATGAYRTLAEAAGQMCRISPAVEPCEANCKIYDEKYQLYTNTIEALDPLWDSIQAYRDKKRAD